MAKKLTGKEMAFVEHYVIHASPTGAYDHAGYANMAKERKGNKAIEILKRPMVKEAITEKRKERSARTGISADLVLRRLWGIASADPNNLVAVKVFNCRHCWGTDFKYQYTEVEWEQLLDEAERLGMEEPNPQGGFKFNASRAPHPDCPSCGGIGKQKLLVKDTTKLDPQSRLLYAGAEPSRYGIKIKMHDQLAALVKVADHLGMFESATVEKLRQANLAKIEAETQNLGKEIAPVKVEIKVVDASNPERHRDDNDTQPDPEHTAE